MPAIIAHRGASHDAPENTLKAFKLALDQGADGIELDVHLSADGHVVVIHDGHLERTTDGSGCVEETTLAELRQFDAGEGEKIPTLAEVLDLVGHKLTTNIEIKGFSGNVRQLPGEVLGLVKDFGLEDHIIYSSFDPRMLIQLQRIDRDARVGMLLPPGSVFARTVFSQFIHPWSLHPHFATVNKAFMRRAERHGYAVYTWTVDQREDIQWMIDLGVDGIITDLPSLAIEVRKAS